ncbi:amidohydrolase family protein [Tissierella carlieri]|uniref:amidohydrolase family protein n=1 Tax=Tissierella carlieri TaxID=689904 RepID=UPI001C0F8CB4|nr:amidohydrolase family protein [Tissierella carlieri]MBU5313271.1 amidohydrolase family protein [Tissierella carlieri]
MIIKNGNIHVGNGIVLDDHDILIENGIIKEIGKNIIVENKKIIDARDKEVFPGFIDPVSSFGCMDISFSIKDHNEASNPITPESKIKYSFNHREIDLEELYKVGITTIGASPGNTNIIGGQMAAYRTWGKNSSTMLIREPVGMKGSIVNNVKDYYGKKNICPMTRMGVFSKLEEFLNNRSEANKEIVDDILGGRLPLFITANKSAEINALLHLIKEFGDIKLNIVGAYQADRCIDSIKDAGASIIVGEQIYLTERRYNETDLYKIAELQKEGNLISFTLTSTYGTGGKVKYLWNAIEFYKVGVDKEEIIKMMTLNPAKMLGIDHILGSIEEGKFADIVIYNKNPIEFYDSRVANTIVHGELVYGEEGFQC